MQVLRREHRDTLESVASEIWRLFSTAIVRVRAVSTERLRHRRCPRPPRRPACSRQSAPSGFWVPEAGRRFKAKRTQVWQRPETSPRLFGQRTHGSDPCERPRRPATSIKAAPFRPELAVRTDPAGSVSLGARPLTASSSTSRAFVVENGVAHDAPVQATAPDGHVFCRGSHRRPGRRRPKVADRRIPCWASGCATLSGGRR